MDEVACELVFTLINILRIRVDSPSDESHAQDSFVVSVQDQSTWMLVVASRPRGS